MHHDVKRILGQHFILKYLPPSDLDHLAQLSAVRTYKAGEPVFLKGDPGTAMMAVLAGRVRICAYSSDGREVVLNVISPGEVFGEIAMIDGGERTADAFAMEETELLVLGRRDFMPVLARNPDVCIKLLELMCRRLRWTSEQMEDISFLDLRSRLAKRLGYLADHHGEPSGEGDRKTVRNLPATARQHDRSLSGGGQHTARRVEGGGSDQLSPRLDNRARSYPIGQHHRGRDLIAVHRGPEPCYCSGWRAAGSNGSDGAGPA